MTSKRVGLNWRKLHNKFKFSPWFSPPWFSIGAIRWHSFHQKNLFQLSNLTLKCKWTKRLRFHSKFKGFSFFIHFDIKFLTKLIKNMIFNAVKKVTDIYIPSFCLYLRYFLSLKKEFICLIKSNSKRYFSIYKNIS